ncbi:uncharacterized protein EHS24_001640 [Apiotrichum porosum]|uniref:Uncharacterized protein n=1 Tax=Apiotrichum porosum TaxID=105984 RepID=A0A427XIM5_9TREE|nr:uncharacterized protein EHS24_001640 [Apiotrichum porosum]RSH78741.1 hypothetical protein EHS24_001640 [Apiotrichum porosum]
MPPVVGGHKRSRKDKPQASPQQAHEPRVTINHTAFPYIISDVITFSSRQALLNLRQTSKMMRTRVDAILSHHLRFEFVDPTRPTAAQLPAYYRGPRTQNYEGDEEITGKLVVTLPDGSPLPAYTLCNNYQPGPATLIQRAVRKRFEASLAHTRVVDILDCSEVPFARALSDVPVARFIPDDHGRHSAICPVKARKCVAFTSVIGKRNSTYWIGSLPPLLPRTVERYVINLEVNPDTYCANSLTHTFDMSTFLDSLRNLPELVIIFSTTDRQVPTHPGHRPAAVPPPLGLLRSFSLRRTEFPHIKITFVGALALNPKCFGFLDDMGEDTLQVKLQARMDEEAVAHHARPYVARKVKSLPLPGPITFMTLNEYRETLTPEDFAVEMVQ